MLPATGAAASGTAEFKLVSAQTLSMFLAGGRSVTLRKRKINKMKYFSDKTRGVKKLVLKKVQAH